MRCSECREVVQLALGVRLHRVLAWLPARWAHLLAAMPPLSNRCIVAKQCLSGPAHVQSDVHCRCSGTGMGSTYVVAFNHPSLWEGVIKALILRGHDGRAGRGPLRRHTSSGFSCTYCRACRIRNVSSMLRPNARLLMVACWITPCMCGDQARRLSLNDQSPDRPSSRTTALKTSTGSFTHVAASDM